jgi:hypothetical protein
MKKKTKTPNKSAGDREKKRKEMLQATQRIKKCSHL